MVNKIDNFRKIPVTEAPSGSIVNGGEVYHGSDPTRPAVSVIVSIYGENIFCSWIFHALWWEGLNG